MTSGDTACCTPEPVTDGGTGDAPMCPSCAALDYQLAAELCQIHVDDRPNGDPESAPGAPYSAEQATPGVLRRRVDLIPLTRGSGNEPRNPTPIRPEGRRGTRADRSFRKPGWWRERIPAGWKPADRVEALALLDEFEAVATRRGRWYRDSRCWRRQLFRLIALYHLESTDHTITVSHQQLVDEYEERYREPMSKGRVQQLWGELREHGFALVVQCAAGLPRTGSRAATYVLLAPGDPEPAPAAAPVTTGLTRQDAVTSTNSETPNPSRLTKVLDLSERSNSKNARGKSCSEEPGLWITPLVGTGPTVWRRRYQLVTQLLERWQLDVSAYMLTRALRRYFDAGWTGRMLLLAADFHPNGHRHPGPVDAESTRSLIGVLLYRLGLHRDPAGDYSPPADWIPTDAELTKARWLAENAAAARNAGVAEDLARDLALDAWIERNRSNPSPSSRSSTEPSGATSRSVPLMSAWRDRLAEQACRRSAARVAATHLADRADRQMLVEQARSRPGATPPLTR